MPSCSSSVPERSRQRLSRSVFFAFVFAVRVVPTTARSARRNLLSMQARRLPLQTPPVPALPELTPGAADLDACRTRVVIPHAGIATSLQAHACATTAARARAPASVARVSCAPAKRTLPAVSIGAAFRAARAAFAPTARPAGVARWNAACRRVSAPADRSGCAKSTSAAASSGARRAPCPGADCANTEHCGYHVGGIVSGLSGRVTLSLNAMAQLELSTERFLSLLQAAARWRRLCGQCLWLSQRASNAAC